MTDMINQLIELFPRVSEEFLSGIYDAHKDEDVTIEELIDVVLSFEFPPQREDATEHSLDTSNVSSNGPIDIKLEIPSLITNSETNQPIVNEVLQKSVPEVKEVSHSKCLESLQETSTESKPSDGVKKYVSNDVLCDDNKKLNDSCGENSRIKVEPNPNMELEEPSNSVVSMPYNEMNKSTVKMNNFTFSTNHDQSSEDEDDSSPECSIRYLMEERNVMERYNINTNVKELAAEISEDNREFVSRSNKPNNDSSDSFAYLNGKALLTKQKKTCRFRKRSDCSNSSQNNRSQSLPHCSAKRVTLRSSKIKNEEERLRRRLISQSRLLHERQEKNINFIVSSSQFLEIDQKYTLLCKVFTDANPTYLLDQCNLLTDQEKILAFISQNLEFRDYPKIETIKEEPGLMEAFHCTVEEFVEVIPDPVAEFSNTNYVRAGYEENAEIYLKARYDGLSDVDVKELLRANSYNLTNVCIQLEAEGKTPTQGVLDYTPLHHSADIFFHQEVWYIENRKKVEDYLDSAIEAIRVEEELNKPPPPPDEVFECKICRDEIVEYVNLGTCDGKTGHLFCLDCIKRSVEVRFGDGETKFPCLVNCGAFIPLQTVQEVLPSHVYDKLMGRIQEDEIRTANIAGVETCPFCPYAYGPGEEALFTCINPGCMKLSCRICREEDHSPEMCAMLKNEDEERVRHIIENRMSEALFRTCHNCGKNIVKSGGCNKMECNCGAKMCYVCRQPVLDYTHFNRPGGDNINRCPLYSDDADLHDRPVEATAEQVFNELATNNPHLNLDRAKIIPN